MTAGSTPSDRTEALAQVRLWMGGFKPSRPALQHQNGRWYMLAPDFDIVGGGDSPREAARELAELVGAYLASYYVAHRPFSEALHPISRWRRLKLSVSTVIFRTLNRIVHEYYDSDAHDDHGPDLPGTVVAHAA